MRINTTKICFRSMFERINIVAVFWFRFMFLAKLSSMSVNLLRTLNLDKYLVQVIEEGTWKSFFYALRVAMSDNSAIIRQDFNVLMS